jgi:opacity protein-like surface antigen
MGARTLMKVFGSAVAMLGTTAIAGHAADLWVPQPGYRGSLKDTYAPQYVKPLGWYLRGDFGWAANNDPDVTGVWTSPLGDGSVGLDDTSFGSTWSVGGGIGRYLTPNIRADFTFDHRFESDVSAGSLGLAGQTGLTSNVLLVNAYYDFGSRSGITPYVGAGIGAANHHTTPVSLPALGLTDITEENDSWTFAGALMAGLTFNVSERVSIDAGYRFLYLGQTETGIADGTAIGLPVTARATIEDITAHELRAGLRIGLN